MALLNSKFKMENDEVIVPAPLDILGITDVNDSTHDISDICNDLCDGQLALGEVISHDDDMGDVLDQSPDEIDDEDVAVAMEAYSYCAAKAGLKYKDIRTVKVKQEGAAKITTSPISRYKVIKSKFSALRVKMEEAIAEQTADNVVNYIQSLDEKLPGWNRQRTDELRTLIDEFTHDDNAVIDVVPEAVLKSLATTLKATSIGCFALLSGRTSEGDIGVLINDFVRNNMTLAAQYKILLKELKDKDFDPTKLHDFQCSYMDTLKAHPDAAEFVKIPIVGPCDPDGVDIVGVTADGDIKYVRLYCSQPDLVSVINNICMVFAKRLINKKIGELKNELHKFLDGAKDLDISLSDDGNVIDELANTPVEHMDAYKLVNIVVIFTGKIASTTKRAFDAQTLVVNDIIHLVHVTDIVSGS